PPGAPSQPAFLYALDRQEKTARATPLRGAELARWGIAYLGLAVSLVLVLWLLRGVPGASAAAALLE
ncbi:MAG: site-2 protease family protein, partial [Anaeromyxobacteraceae bacterium]